MYCPISVVNIEVHILDLRQRESVIYGDHVRRARSCVFVYACVRLITRIRDCKPLMRVNTFLSKFLIVRVFHSLNVCLRFLNGLYDLVFV